VGADRTRSGAGLSAPRRGAIAVAGLVVAASAGCTAHDAPAPEDSYGALPTYLPSAAVQPDSILVGSADRPAVTSQGDEVRVRLAGNSVVAEVTGPQVPGDGLPVQTDATTCTWTVTLTGPQAALPIAAADFSTVDHLGVVYHPVFVPGQPRPPAVLGPGRSVTFELRTVMKTGEGLMRWAPGGRKIVASWDFEVEND
jgi:hypothetical protein